MLTKTHIVALIMSTAMAVTAAAATHLKPSLHLADTRPVLKIEPALPKAFGTWQMANITSGVVNPQQEDLLNTLYSEIINRTYVNANGQQIMLSIAYGKNQNDSFQVHKPEICYPAQGFQLLTNVRGQLDTAIGQIPVRRLETMLGNQRPEAVTYWTTIGDQFVSSGTDKKLKEMRYAMQGYIADGLLFRVSSIDPDSARAFRAHQSFIEDLLSTLSPENRRRLAGLS